LKESATVETLIHAWDINNQGLRVAGAVKTIQVSDKYGASGKSGDDLLGLFGWLWHIAALEVNGIGEWLGNKE
jgi:hypothetical protein